MNKETKREMSVYIDWVMSLHQSINNSGGNVQWTNIKNMTVEELGWLLAPNGIRFVYDKNRSINYERL